MLVNVSVNPVNVLAIPLNVLVVRNKSFNKILLKA